MIIFLIFTSITERVQAYGLYRYIKLSIGSIGYIDLKSIFNSFFITKLQADPGEKYRVMHCNLNQVQYIFLLKPFLTVGHER